MSEGGREIVDDDPTGYVDWATVNGDFVPVCTICRWSGLPRIYHHQAVTALRRHRTSKRHQET